MTSREIYFVGGLGLLLLTCALLVASALGPAKEYVRQHLRKPNRDVRTYEYVRSSQIEVLTPFLAFMLSWAGAGVALGLVQRFVAWPEGLKRLVALAYVLGVLGYVFVFYWNVSEQNRLAPDVWRNPVTWAVFLGGFVLLLSLVINALGVMRFSTLSTPRIEGGE